MNTSYISYKQTNNRYVLITLCFIVSPQILPFDFGEESVNSGDLASVMCSVHKGDLPINITWLHNNKSLEYDFGISIVKNGKKVTSLTIDSVGEEHAGLYTCTAENDAGSDSYSTTLNINGTLT